MFVLGGLLEACLQFFNYPSLIQEMVKKNSSPIF
jgi:hypothetical protein